MRLTSDSGRTRAVSALRRPPVGYTTLHKRIRLVVLLWTAIAWSNPLAFAAPGVYIQRGELDGLIVIEAENFAANQAVDGHAWEPTTAMPGFSGAAAMTALPDNGADEDDPDYEDAAYVDYQVYFVRTGRHYIWLRGWGIDDGNGCHLDLDHRELENGREIEFAEGRWNWSHESDDEEFAYFDVEKPGLHTISLCLQEDGVAVDRILLTADPDFIPRGAGPEQTIAGAVISLESAIFAAKESAPQPQTVKVVNWGPRDKPVSVDYAVVDGTADAADFQLDAGTIHFDPGQAAAQLPLRVVNDETDEPDETIVIQLSNPRGEGAQLGEVSRATYTIVDPRPRLEFVGAASGVAEQEGHVIVPVRLSESFEKPVAATAEVVGGSAGKEDYVLATGRIEIPPGKTKGGLRLVIAADGATEPTETIRLALRDANNARLSGRNEHTVFICQRSYDKLGDAIYFRHESGARWERFAKVGSYADVMVRFAPGDDRLIFWRGASYRPFLDTAAGAHYFDVAVPQRGDGPAPMFDRTNRHSHVRIIENSPARVIVQWRYFPDFQRRSLPWWTEEYFTVYPDGICYRSIHEGAETLAAYHDPDHARVEPLLLTREGVCPLPAIWRGVPQATFDQTTQDAYAKIGFDRSRGSFSLSAQSPGVANPIVFTADGPIIRPALFVQGWGDAGVKVAINDQVVNRYQVGSVATMANKDLVLWLNVELARGDQVVIEPVGGSAPIRRAPVRDPYLADVPLLPEGSSDPGPFGAYYKTLKYWTEWDEPWRVGDYADVVVQFDSSPNRLVFWRGTTNVPHWVNDANHWYSNEFCERRGRDSGLDGLCEPMQDHDSDVSHVRIISSTPARTVVHWRYSPITLDGNIPFEDETGWGDCVDEYHYVYPDETCVRDTTLYTSRPNVFNEWHEAIPLVNPGMIPEDVLEMKAILCANMSGAVKAFDFEQSFPEDREFEDGYNILLVNLKGRSKPFAICESAGQWWDPISRPDETRFNHYDDWPAWPARYRRGDWDRDPENNYREFWKILPSHSSLMHLDWDNYESDLDGPVVFLRKILLNGMIANDNPGLLVPLANYWERPPAVEVSGYGFSPAWFDKAQKAFRLERRISWIDEMVNRDDDKMVNRDADQVEIRLRPSATGPIINPCFVIDNWPADAKARLFIDGTEVVESPDFRQGIEKRWKDWEIRSALVVWVRHKAEQSTVYRIEMERGSGTR